MRLRKKNFYFVGIGGAGMSGMAEILLDLGHAVSGSDREKSEITEYLANKGATIYYGHSADNLRETDFLVFSSAIPMNNPEIQKASQMNIPVIRRAEMLGQLFNRKFGIGVAGTHGKTTTTSMLGTVLINADYDPTIIVGGRLHNLKTSALLGKSEYFIAEADEYDHSFLTLYPRLAIITSLEADHLDIYENLEDVKNSFVQFANQIPFDGAIVLNADEEHIQCIQPRINGAQITYSLHNSANYMGKNLQFDKMKASFDAYHNKKLLGTVSLNIPGEYNIKNALAVVAAATELEIPFDTIQRGLAEFNGVGRRFEIVEEVKNILVVDDYSHHPTEVAAAIRAAKTGWDRRVIAVFQPHLFSRTKDFHREFASALSEADVTLVTNIYPAREEPLPGVDGRMIAGGLQNKHYYVKEKTDITNELLKIVDTGDLVLFMGAGDIWKYSRAFADGLREK